MTTSVTSEITLAFSRLAVSGAPAQFVKSHATKGSDLPKFKTRSLAQQADPAQPAPGVATQEAGSQMCSTTAPLKSCFKRHTGMPKAVHFKHHGYERAEVRSYIWSETPEVRNYLPSETLPEGYHPGFYKSTEVTPKPTPCIGPTSCAASIPPIRLPIYCARDGTEYMVKYDGAFVKPTHSSRILPEGRSSCTVCRSIASAGGHDVVYRPIEEVPYWDTHKEDNCPSFRPRCSEHPLMLDDEDSSFNDADESFDLDLDTF